jgi:WD40 repeat protein
LTVITGGAGSGKSALLGVLVCALHPRLREATAHLWRHIAVPGAWDGPLATVHLRERTLSDATAALVRQLRLPLPSEVSARQVIEVITAMDSPPLIIADALDEANGQDAVHRQLLQPLAAAVRPDGRAACTLWVGTRPWCQFDDLLRLAADTGHLVNLDHVPTHRLAVELADYVETLLTHAPAYRDSYLRRVRASLARGVADALTHQDRDRGGEFLIAALYTHWLLRRPGHPAPGADVSALLNQIPRDVPGVLDLDLSTRDDQPWLRALLITLAHAHGAGMPATVLRRTAAAFHPDADASEITVTDFDRLLRQVRFYLRSTPDSDGTSLYRLFHQSLVDHLRDPDTDLIGLVARLLDAVPTDDAGRPRPEAAEPYVQRHWLQHAADAGRLDLCVHDDPTDLVPVLNAAARTRQGRLGAAIYRQSAHLVSFSDIKARRELLTIDATRYGALGLAQWLVDDMSSPAFQPAWSTGGAVMPWLSTLISGHTARVYAVALGQVDGRAVVVSGSDDGTVRVWDAATGTLVGGPFTGHTAGVYAVALGQVDGHAVVVSGSEDATVRVWDAATGTPVGAPFTGHTGWVRAVALGQIDGRAVIVSGSYDGTVRVWDAATGTPVGAPFTNRTGPVAAVAVVALGQVGGRTVVVSGGGDGTVRVWDAATGTSVGAPFTGHTGPVYAVALGQVDGRTVVVSGSEDAAVRVWDAATGTSVGAPFTGHTGPVYAVALGQVDGRTVVVSGSEDGTVRVWDAATGAPVGVPFTGHTRGVTAVALGQVDGRAVVVSGGGDRTLRVWDAATGTSIGNPLTGHTGPVAAVALGQVEGRTVIISGGNDGTVRAWPLTFRRRKPPGYVSRHERAGNVVAIDSESAASSIAVSGGDDGVLRWWDLRSGRQLATWTLPYVIKTVATLPGSGFAVGYGDEVAVFRPVDGTERLSTTL